MSKRRGQQKGAQRHAEGQHGSRTRDAFLESRRAASLESEVASKEPRDVDVYGQPAPGRRRLLEDRDQHDEAEKNSEANTLRCT